MSSNSITNTSQEHQMLSEQNVKRIKEMLWAILCLLLCLVQYVVNGEQGSVAPSEPAASSESAVPAAPAAEVTEPNTDAQSATSGTNVEAAARDDDCRTTYEIFVSSFCDSDGDGIGDINGIRQKLDYISGMGFDQIWLTPVHPSNTYHKYDVDDYCAIDPAFGTMEDYEALLQECHARGIRVLMDLVLNHTSDTHPWFRAASDYLHELPSDWEPSEEYCPYYGYYHFSREPQEGYAQLSGTNWYYEARFWSEMPDLNLDNERVRNEIRDILQFWLDKGVDGFRLDATTSYVTNNPGANVEFLRFLTQACRSIDPDCYLVGEAWTDQSSIANLYASGIDSLFEFPFAGPNGIICSVMKGNRAASDYVRAMVDAEAAYRQANQDYVGAPFYTNHDMDRSTGYYGSDDGSLTKMSYAMSLLMPGDSFVYYGEEIGMSGSGKDENRRAPMRWSSDANAAGMCTGPSGMDEGQKKFSSLEEQMADDRSLWNWFAKVIRVRKAYPAIARGTTEAVDSISDGSVAAFIRRSAADEDVLVVMNLRNQPVTKNLSAVGSDLRLAEVLTTGEEGISYESGNLSLPAYSIAVLTLGGM